MLGSISKNSETLEKLKELTKLSENELSEREKEIEKEIKEVEELQHRLLTAKEKTLEFSCSLNDLLGNNAGNAIAAAYSLIQPKIVELEQREKTLRPQQALIIYKKLEPILSWHNEGVNYSTYNISASLATSLKALNNLDKQSLELNAKNIKGQIKDVLHEKICLRKSLDELIALRRALQTGQKAIVKEATKRGEVSTSVICEINIQEYLDLESKSEKGLNVLEQQVGELRLKQAVLVGKWLALSGIQLGYTSHATPGRLADVEVDQGATRPCRGNQ